MSGGRPNAATSGNSRSDNVSNTATGVIFVNHKIAKNQNIPPNASITITGTEKYVNSGWMFPAGPLPGSSSTFRVTFEKVGTYNYDCLLHPWMDGKVVVS